MEFPMLVLSRSEGQKIVVDEDIVITVLKIEGNRVRLGIDAPRSVPIRRSELEFVADELPDWTESHTELSVKFGPCRAR
jgi:carbon storage regulator CsrA